MLKVYLHGKTKPSVEAVPDGMEVVTDVDTEYTGLGADVTEAGKRIVKEVDEGDLRARGFFIDRFGRMLSTEKLSTGSKAGLLVLSGRKAVDLVECPINAVSAIMKNCKDGYVVMRTPLQDLIGDDDTPVDVLVNGHHFKTIGELNYYFSDGIVEDAVSGKEYED